MGDSVGGSHISALELVNELDRTRFEPIVAIHREGVLSTHLRSRGITAVRAPQLFPNPLKGKFALYSPATLMAVPRLARFLGRNNIAIVHTNDGRMQFLWGAASMCARSKFVLHVRNIGDFNIKISSLFADAMPVISCYCRENMPSRAAQRAEIVTNPFRPPLLQEERGLSRSRMLEKTGTSSETPAIVGYIANFIERKRPKLFVEVAALLEARLGGRALFPMFGDAERLSSRRLVAEVKGAIKQKGLSSHCIFMGMRYPIEPWIAGLDVLVAPAVREAFGRTLVEAMLCGTPVVAADDGGHREIIRHGKTGLLVEAGQSRCACGCSRRTAGEAGDGAVHGRRRQGRGAKEILGRGARGANSIHLREDTAMTMPAGGKGEMRARFGLPAGGATITPHQFDGPLTRRAAGPPAASAQK